MDFVRERGFGFSTERKMLVPNYGNTGALDMVARLTCVGGVASISLRLRPCSSFVTVKQAQSAK